MGLLKGGMAHTIMRISGTVGVDDMKAALREYRFDEPDANKQDAIEAVRGWVDLDDASGTEFSDAILGSATVAFSLRTDRKKISSTYRKAKRKERVNAWLEAHERERIPADERKAIYEAIDEELLRRALPTVSTIDVVYKRGHKDGALIIFHTSPAQVSAVQEYFNEMLVNAAKLDDVAASHAPFLPDLQKTLSCSQAELGSDFLGWLWRWIDMGDELVEGVKLVDRIKLLSGEDGSSTLHVGEDPAHGETISVDRRLRRPSELRVQFEMSDLGVTMGLTTSDSTGICVSSLKLGGWKPEKGSEVAAIATERAMLLESVRDRLNEWIDQFAEDRAQDDWEDTYRAWAAGEEIEDDEGLEDE